MTPWRSPLARALHRNRSLPQARFIQLATVRADGRPANRTVVFRGFRDDTDQLQIVTDARSEKIAEILHSPWGEICWYFPKTREQFRISGQLILVPENTTELLAVARQQAWLNLSDAARRQFAWPPPGLPVSPSPRSVSEAEPPLPVSESPLPQFCLLLLEPAAVDWLELRPEPQSRWLYQCQEDGTWSATAINP
ncbi:MAG TPA: pyridoxamine 5'-phosphate oxidase family protein [Oscillatoriaceae cyanobacterium M33_DOE_052]|uniref:Pyridoxamine 5'-phosphate oxidase n=1 Tax=Planktothricoides sp. SpSt-374 TaxID=2282167 RepID=A0A7C3ZJC4_9CYAN|nr:pyridoxamine 5'-phosphate oxidase family protein [Oscillatoriaceae cyanobacterium M33_DOE_052]